MLGNRATGSSSGLGVDGWESECSAGLKVVSRRRSTRTVSLKRSILRGDAPGLQGTSLVDGMTFVHFFVCWRGCMWHSLF